MRKKLLLVFLVIGIGGILLVLRIVSMNNRTDAFIYETPQMNLPKGAKARIGKGRILDVAYVPDGTQFAVASSTGIWFYDANTLEVQAMLPGHSGIEFSMSFSPDGKTLATVNGGKTIHLWDTETLKHKTTFIRDTYLRPYFVFDYVSFIGDGETLASSYSGYIDLWNVATNTYHSEYHIPSGDNTVISPDGSVLAYSRGEVVHLWSVLRGMERREFIGHTKSVKYVAFSHDGKMLASGSRDNTIKLWDIETGEHKITLEGHKESVECLDFSPDGKTLASGSHDHTVRLWDVATGKRKKTLKKHSDELRKVLFSPDGKTLLSYSRKSNLHLWDVTSGKIKNTLRDHFNFATSISLSPDGLTLVSGSYDKTVRLWDVATGKHKMALKGHRDVVLSVSYSPDGLTIASGGIDKTVRLWDATTGKQKKTLKGHASMVHRVLFNSDGNLLASQNGLSIRLWDAATGKQKNIFTRDPHKYFKGGYRLVRMGKS